jgi:hypothetical protein
MVLPRIEYKDNKFVVNKLQVLFFDFLFLQKSRLSLQRENYFCPIGLLYIIVGGTTLLC